MLLKELLLSLISLLVAWFLSVSTVLAIEKNDIGDFSQTTRLPPASFSLKASSPRQEKEVKCRQSDGLSAKYFCTEINKDSLQAGTEEKEANHERAKTR